MSARDIDTPGFTVADMEHGLMTLVANWNGSGTEFLTIARRMTSAYFDMNREADEATVQALGRYAVPEDRDDDEDV